MNDTLQLATDAVMHLRDTVDEIKKAIEECNKALSHAQATSETIGKLLFQLGNTALIEQ